MATEIWKNPEGLTATSFAGPAEQTESKSRMRLTVGYGFDPYWDLELTAEEAKNLGAAMVTWAAKHLGEG